MRSPLFPGKESSRFIHSGKHFEKKISNGTRCGGLPTRLVICTIAGIEPVGSEILVSAHALHDSSCSAASSSMTDEFTGWPRYTYFKSTI